MVRCSNNQRQHRTIFSGRPCKYDKSFQFILLQTSQSVGAYTILCEKYKQFIDRDPQYLEYLDKIGQNYFGIPPPARARPGGMFSGLFDQLLSAMNDDSEDDDDVPGPSRPTPATVTSTATKKLEQEDLD